jgi:hypothetical protein
MKVAKATVVIFVFWLLATPYWNDCLRVCSHSTSDCHKCSSIDTKINTLIQILTSYIENVEHKILIRNNYIFSLVTSHLQAPLVDKWNGEMSRGKRRISIVTKNNTQTCCDCRMAHSRSLDKSFDGVKDMETSQNKKRSSSLTCLTIVEKNKNKNASKKNAHLWLGFKALNALNANKELDEIAHSSVSELVKSGMCEKEALECQNCVPSYPYVLQEMWPSTNDLGEQNYHHTQKFHHE